MSNVMQKSVMHKHESTRWCPNCQIGKQTAKTITFTARVNDYLLQVRDWLSRAVILLRAITPVEDETAAAYPAVGRIYRAQVLRELGGALMKCLEAPQLSSEVSGPRAAIAAWDVICLRPIPHVRRGGV